MLLLEVGKPWRYTAITFMCLRVSEADGAAATVRPKDDI